MDWVAPRIPFFPTALNVLSATRRRRPDCLKYQSADKQGTGSRSKKTKYLIVGGRVTVSILFIVHVV